MGYSSSKNDKHIIYVWLDALTNYLSAINFPDTNDKKFKEFCLQIFILLERYTKISCNLLVSFFVGCKITSSKKIFGHGWILSDEKMSKSLGNILTQLK